MESKIDELLADKKKMTFLVKETKKSRNELHETSKNGMQGRDIENAQNTVKEISTYRTLQQAISGQDFELRDKYIHAVSKDIKSRKKVRRRLLTFYIWFTIVVTACIFFIVIDPVRLLSGKNSFYPLSLKILLCGTFFANIISIIVLMIKYSFAPIDNFMDAFKDLGISEYFKKDKQ